MRRYIALMVACAAFVTALGCRHIGGKCDCGYNPNDYPITGPVAPYPSAPVLKAPPPPPKGGNQE